MERAVACLNRTGLSGVSCCSMNSVWRYPTNNLRSYLGFHSVPERGSKAPNRSQIDARQCPFKQNLSDFHAIEQDVKGVPHNYKTLPIQYCLNPQP